MDSVRCSWHHLADLHDDRCLDSDKLSTLLIDSANDRFSRPLCGGAFSEFCGHLGFALFSELSTKNPGRLSVVLYGMIQLRSKL